MKDASSDRRLTIGAYAAATQLTAKALRLYDDQGLLRPSTTDAATGYRYYRTEQVATGRLIRALREMNLSLAQVALVLDAPLGERAVLLRSFLQEAEQRLAHERNAYQSALMMLRPHAIADVAQIEEQSAPAQVVAILEFSTTRRAFVEQALQQRRVSLQQLNSSSLRTRSQCSFALVEPLTDDEGRVELMIPIDVTSDSNLQGVTTRHVPMRKYAAVAATPAGLPPSPERECATLVLRVGFGKSRSFRYRDASLSGIPSVLDLDYTNGVVESHSVNPEEAWKESGQEPCGASFQRPAPGWTGSCLAANPACARRSHR